jgi:hypothetical protein
VTGVETADGGESIFLGAADDQPGDDVGDAHPGGADSSED